jgi:hypothetical protein
VPSSHEGPIDSEMRFHVSVDTAAKQHPDAARHRFGNVTYLKRETR